MTPTTAPSAIDGWVRGPDQASLAGATIGEVIWTGARFVAVATDFTQPGLLLDSPDGRLWHRLLVGGTDAWTTGPDRLGAGANGVIAIGGGNGGPIAIWRSPEGLSWARVPDQAAFAMRDGAFEDVAGIVATADGWLAVGGGQYNSTEPALRGAIVLTSRDGDHWTRQPGSPTLDSASMYGIVRLGAGYVSVGAVVGRSPAGTAELHPAVWASSDGRTWSRSSIEPTYAPHDGSPRPRRTDVVLDSVAAVGSRVVVVGHVAESDESSGSPSRPREAVAWWSDGGAWMQVPLGARVAVAQLHVARVGDRFLALAGPDPDGCSAGLWASTDGTSWLCVGNDPALAGFAISGFTAAPDIDVLVGSARSSQAGSSAVWTMALH